MQFYLCGAWHKQLNQAKECYDRGHHGQINFMTEAIPLLQKRGWDVRPNHWGAIEKHPEMHAEIWGAFFERDGWAIDRFRLALPDFDWDKKWIICRFHACHQAQANEFQKFLPYCNVFLGTHQVVVDQIRAKLKPSAPVDVCPWGTPTFWEYPPPHPNPYPPGTRNIVWAGRLSTDDQRRMRIFKKIEQRDPSVKIHIITMSDKHRERDGFDPAKLPANCVNHGAIQSGTFNHWVYYADLALDTGIPEMYWLNCKMYDYLGMGCPVVCNNVPGAEPVAETGHGIVIDSFTADDHVDAVFEAFDREWRPRDEIIAYMQAHHGWDKATDVLEKYMQMGVDLGFAG